MKRSSLSVPPLRPPSQSLLVSHGASQAQCWEGDEERAVTFIHWGNIPALNGDLSQLQSTILPAPKKGGPSFWVTESWSDLAGPRLTLQLSWSRRQLGQHITPSCSSHLPVWSPRAMATWSAPQGQQSLCP